MTRQTPFHNVGIEQGAQMRDLFGYWLPWEYGAGHIEEHQGTRQRASLCDLDYMGEYTIEGPDALAFVQQLFTNDFRNLPIGGVRYTAMTNFDGNMMDDGTVWRLGESKYMYVSGDEADYEWIQKRSSGFDVQLKNITSEWTTLALQGPASTEILKKLTSVDLGQIRYYHFVEGKVAGVDCLVARMGYTGEFGYELHFHPKYGEDIWKAVMDAGAGDQIVPCGQAALESLRQEAGYLLVGNDHNKSTNPLEAGIGWTVKFDKGDFNGKEALLKILKQGVGRQLVWFKLADDAVANTGDPIMNFGQKIGEVTSGSFSPTIRRGVVMGYVRPEFAIPGVQFSIQTGGKEHRATLSIMPLYDPGDVISNP
jgi:aminomethyltransferase